MFKSKAKEKDKIKVKALVFLKTGQRLETFFDEDMSFGIASLTNRGLFTIVGIDPNTRYYVQGDNIAYIEVKC